MHPVPKANKTEQSLGQPFWFPVAFLLMLLVFYGQLRTLVTLAIQDEHYSHAVTIPFISAGLLYLKRQKVFRQARLCPKIGLPLLILGIAICNGASHARLSTDAGLFVQVFGIIVAWTAIFLFCYGPSSYKAATFPLVLLLLMLPIPMPLLDEIVSVLRAGSSEMTSLLFGILHVPAFREGFRFSVPHFTIEIAKECSSIRSATALFITGLLVAHLSLRSNVKRACLVLLTAPIAMFTNAVRIVTLTCLAIYVDPSFLFGSLHHSGGVLFSLISVAILAAVMVLFRNSECRKQSAHAQGTRA